MGDGNKRYAIEPGTGRRVLVEAYGDKIANLNELGYRMLSDEEITAQREAYESGKATSSPLRSSDFKATSEEGEPGEEETAGEVTWDDVTKPQIAAYAERHGVADFPKSGTKADYIAALGDGVSPADVKGEES